MLLPVAAAALRESLPALPSKAFKFEDLPVRVNGENRFRPVMRGATHTGFPIEVHETDLAPGEQPADKLLACDVKVDRGLYLGAEGVSRGEGRLGLLDGAREPVEDVAAVLGRRNHGFAQHIPYEGIRNQIAAVNVGLDLLPERRLVLDVLSQQVATGDMGNAEPLG